MFLVDTAIDVVFLRGASKKRYNYILNLLKYTNRRLGLLKHILLCKNFSILLILQQLISYHKRLILPFLNRLYDFFLTVLHEILEVHPFDLLKYGIVQFKLLFFLHEKGATDTVVNGNLGTEPWVVFDVVDFDTFWWVHLQHFWDEVLGRGAEALWHRVNALYVREM